MVYNSISTHTILVPTQFNYIGHFSTWLTILRDVTDVTEMLAELIFKLRALHCRIAAAAFALHYFKVSFKVFLLSNVSFELMFRFSSEPLGLIWHFHFKVLDYFKEYDSFWQCVMK